jgi:plastocyanin
MAKIPVFDALRIIPREAAFLNRKIGSRGEIFYDRDANTLRLYNGSDVSGVELAKANLSNISNAEFLAKSIAAGVAGSTGGNFELTIAADDSTTRTLTSGNVLQFTGSSGISTTSTADGEIVIGNTQPNFSTITIAGQTSVTANAPSSTLSLVAGNNITLTTSGNSINIAATGGPSANSFSTIAVSGQSNVVADSSTDTLTLFAGTGITLVTDATTDTITINNVAATGATVFTDLSDAAGLTVDRFYLPAITMLNVSNSGAAAYRFDQYGSFDNPTIYAINGTTIAFRLTATGHPFLIQNGAGTNYSTGLTHVSTAGVVSTGASAQGKDSGTLYWKIPTDISGGYRYQCSLHAPMVGLISIKLFSSL